MTAQRARVTSGDAALLLAIERTHNVVEAARSVRMSRDRATYRLQRLASAFGRPVAAARRGGRGHGETWLTPLGDAIARGGFEELELVQGRPELPATRPNIFRGTYHAGPPAHVTLEHGGARLRVAFPASDGERVGLLLDPDAILLARGQFRSSARNVLAATVTRVRPGRGPSGQLVELRTGRTVLRATVTSETLRELGLRRGQRTYVYVKATALRPIA